MRAPCDLAMAVIEVKTASWSLRPSLRVLMAARLAEQEIRPSARAPNSSRSWFENLPKRPLAGVKASAATATAKPICRQSRMW